MGSSLEQKPPRPSLGSSVQEFCRNSSAHGLGHLPDGPERSRYTWLVVVLVLLVLLFYNVGTSLHREALVQPVKTENTWHLARHPMPLPRTVFCDLSVFRQSRLDTRNVSNELASYLASSLGGNTFTTPDFIQDTDKQARLLSEYERLLRPGESYTQLVESLSPTCEDMFKSCFLSGETVSGPACCRTLITPVYTIRGKCFRVKDALQSGDGKMLGSQFLMSLPPAEFPQLDRTIVASCMNTRLGVEVLLDDPGRLPHFRVVSHSVAMSAPAAIELRVSQHAIDRTGLMDSTFPALRHCAAANGSRPAESIDNCPVLRLAEQVRAACGCHWLSLPEDPDAAEPMPVCSPAQIFSCVVATQRRMTPPACDAACREDIFQPAVIAAQNSPVMRDMMESTYNIPRAGQLNVRVYLVSLQYQMVRQWCQTGSELLAELGGHMGLFLGVSVVTVCEALAALFGCLGGACGGRRRVDRGGDDQSDEQRPRQGQPQKQPQISGATQSAKDQTIHISFNCSGPLDSLMKVPRAGHLPLAYQTSDSLANH